MRTLTLFLALWLVALLPGAVGAQEALQPQAPPETGAWTLAPGFTPDPLRVPALIGGGDIDAVHRQLGADCAGFITAEPDVRLTLEQPMPLLNLAFVADALTTDTTLVVYAPDGTFHCNNNHSPGLFNPMVTLNPALAGDYAIWVGGFTPEVPVYGELFVTTRADAQPGSTGLVLPVAT
ncbi:MAG TPA: hypothetical protein VER79_14480, partial [Candidatus Limnocylindrales bacterium]|nr:hypothetical protein [Candidatus Limnocylindrales bacterium]